MVSPPDGDWHCPYCDAETQIDHSEEEEESEDDGSSANLGFALGTVSDIELDMEIEGLFQLDQDENQDADEGHEPMTDVPRTPSPELVPMETAEEWLGLELQDGEPTDDRHPYESPAVPPASRSSKKAPSVRSGKATKPAGSRKLAKSAAAPTSSNVQIASTSGQGRIASRSDEPRRSEVATRPNLNSESPDVDVRSDDDEEASSDDDSSDSSEIVSDHGLVHRLVEWHVFCGRFETPDPVLSGSNGREHYLLDGNRTRLTRRL